MSLDQYVLHITESNAAMYGSLRQQYFEDEHGTVRQANAILRSKPQSEVDLQTAKWSKPMNLAELHKAVRDLVPSNVTTFVELTVKKFSHRLLEEPEVEVSIWASITDGPSARAEAPTAEEAFQEFSTKGMRDLGLTESRPALERLAAMDASTEALTA